MLSKLSRFATVAAIAAFASLGCARQVQPAAPTPPPAVVAPPPPPAPSVAKGYTMSAPGWVVTQEDEMEGDEPQRVAEYELKVNEDLSFAAYVEQMKLDVVDSVTFLEKMREEANGNPAMKVIGQRMTKVGALDAYEVLYALKLEHGIALVLGLFVTDADGKAFYVTCGGNIKLGEDVLKACKPLIKSFRYAK